MYRIKIDPEVLRRFPHYTLLVIYARGLQGGPSDDFSLGELRKAEQLQREQFVDRKPSEHPHIAAWREAYSTFGLKPSKFLCSVEALLNRSLKGNDLPGINRLVDLYNAVSVKHVIPVGGENWDHLESDLVLRFAGGSEPFDIIKDSAPFIDHPQTGEVVWADSAGVTCRAWNWRQCVRTRLTENTVNAYFIFDCLQPYRLESLRNAGDELMGYMRQLSPGCELESEWHGYS